MVITGSGHHVKVGARSAGYGPVPTVPDTPVDIPGEKSLKVQVHLEHVLQI